MIKKPGRPKGTTKGRKKISESISVDNAAWLKAQKKPGVTIASVLDRLIDVERLKALLARD